MPPLLRLDETRLVGADHRLEAVSQPDFGEHAADVGLRRVLTDQLYSDLWVRQSSIQQDQHRPLDAEPALGMSEVIEQDIRGFRRLDAE